MSEDANNCSASMDVETQNDCGSVNGKLDCLDVKGTCKTESLANNSADEKVVIAAKLKRLMKKNDSGICDEKSENSSDEEGLSKRQDEEPSNSSKEDAEGTSVESPVQCEFPKIKGKVSSRNYRKHSKGEGDLSSDEEFLGDFMTSGNENSKAAVDGCVANENLEVATISEKQDDYKPSENSPDSGQFESMSGAVVDMDDSTNTCGGAEDDDDEDDVCRFVRNSRTYRKRSHGPDADSDSESKEQRNDPKSSDSEDEGEKEVARVLLKPKPKHKWFVVQEVVKRESGVSTNKAGPELFQRRYGGSLHVVQRLELMSKLTNHHGCVNTLHFNTSGSRLASGSDDLSICIWDWASSKLLVSYDSGHRSNVFQAKFLPLMGDTHIISCARDGQVRLAELSSTGVCRSTRRLAQHRGPAHKLAILLDSPHVFLSAGEDSVVFNLDVRDSKPNKILTVKEGDKKVALYSIHANPFYTNEFCVSGRDHYVRIYDKRRISETDGPVKKFCPQHLLKPNTLTHVTCAVFNYNGTEILGSYNDEDIYLFDTRHSDGAEYIHKYEGHRNNATVKGVNFFGPRSEFVVSGSDCGNIFFWEKETEAIVQWMPGDENGVVNCLEPHPQLPVLATSGLDDDVKIWVPSNENDPILDRLKSTVIENQKGRMNDLHRDPDNFDGQMLWILWRHIRRTERRRRMTRQSTLNGCGTNQEGGEESSSSSNLDSDSEDSDDMRRRVQCSPS